MGNPRAALLVYYSRQGSVDAERTREVRARLIEWLVDRYPQDEILGSSFAVINSSGEPLADAQACKRVEELWLAALETYPNDILVLEHAANFLRIADPAKAIEILRRFPIWKPNMSRLGNIYGLCALGASAVGPDGNVIAAANTIPTFGFPAQVQAALLKSDDAKFMLSALWTITGAARSLSKLAFTGRVRGILRQRFEARPRNLPRHHCLLRRCVPSQ